MDNHLKSSGCFPIEVATHSMYFHENSPVLSTDGINDIIATCGYDKVVRLWKIRNKKRVYKDNTYKIAHDSSICIDFYKEMGGFKKAINCVRFNKYQSVVNDNIKNNIINDNIKNNIIDDNIINESNSEDTDITQSNTMNFNSMNSNSINFNTLNSNSINSNSINSNSINSNSLNSNSIIPFMLAACSDDGKVIIFTENTSILIRDDDGDDAYDLCWTPHNLIVGFSSGKVEIYKIPNKTDKGINEKINKNYYLVASTNAHDLTIQGISYNEKYDLFATHSLDHRIKVFSINNQKEVIGNNQKEVNGNNQKEVIGNSGNEVFDNNINITNITNEVLNNNITINTLSEIKEGVDNSSGLFKRLFFNNNLLYTFGKKNTCLVYSYPFKEVNLQMKIGPLDSPIVKILEKVLEENILEENMLEENMLEENILEKVGSNNNSTNTLSNKILFICTKKNVYLFKNNDMIVCIDSLTFKAVTDAFIMDNTLFVSSMDGFLATVKIRCS